MKKPTRDEIGNGMAGVRIARGTAEDRADLYDITVFGAEPHPNYNRILLSPVLAGEQTIDQIVLNPLSWYAEHGIRCTWARRCSPSIAAAASCAPPTAPRRATTGCCSPRIAPVHPAGAGSTIYGA